MGRPRLRSPPPSGKLNPELLAESPCRQLAGAPCTAGPNIGGIQRGASGARCQERPDRGTFSSRPELAKGNPEQFVEQTESRLRMPAFQDDELLAKREVLQHQVLARTNKAKDGSEPDPEKVEHSGKVIADRILVRPPMLLISKPDGIVASDTGHLS